MEKKCFQPGNAFLTNQVGVLAPHLRGMGWGGVVGGVVKDVEGEGVGVGVVSE